MVKAGCPIHLEMVDNDETGQKMVLIQSIHGTQKEIHRQVDEKNISYADINGDSSLLNY